MTDDDDLGLGRFLEELRATGTVVSGPVEGEPADEWGPAPVEWLVTAHRGRPVDPPYRLQLSAEEFADALRHDVAVMERWWPAEEPLRRARAALLTSLDAALVGIDETPHAFLLEADGRLHLTTQHPCPDPLPHLDPDSGPFSWSASAPGEPGFDELPARSSRWSPHRRHADLVRAWLVVEASMGAAEVDPAVSYLQDQVDRTFGPGAMLRFTDHVQAWGLQDAEVDAEMRSIARADDERLDALLDALAGEPRES